MKTVFLHGALQKLHQGGRIDIDVRSPLEAMRFLSSVLPGFKREILRAAYFLAREKNGPHIDVAHYGLAFGHHRTLHILPDLSGAKAGGAGAGISPEASAYESRDEEDVSALFNGGINTTEQGMCVPVIYGRMRRAGSAVISAGISVEEIPYQVPNDRGNGNGSWRER